MRTTMFTAGVEYPWLELPVSIAFWGKEELQKAHDHLALLEKASLHGTVHFEEAKTRLAGIALYQGKVAHAKSQLEQLLDVSQNRVYYLLFLSEVDALLGDQAEAVSRAKKVLRGCPELS